MPTDPRRAVPLRPAPRPRTLHDAAAVPLPRSAGVRLFDPAAAAHVEGADRLAAAAITGYLMLLRLPVEGLQVGFDGTLGVVRLSGRVPDRATRDELLLRCHRVQGVLAVHDALSLGDAAPR